MFREKIKFAATACHKIDSTSPRQNELNHLEIE